MENVNLEDLGNKLRNFGLLEFDKEHYKYLYNKTAHLDVFGLELRRQGILVQSELDACTSHPGGFEKNKNLYRYVVAKDNPKGFLLALKESNNFTVINFISEHLESATYKSGTARTSVQFSSELADYDIQESLKPMQFSSQQLLLPRTAIGIHFGTTNSRVATFQDRETVIVPNDVGRYDTPNYVGFDDDGTTVVGDAAKRRSDIMPENRIFDVNRFIGRTFSDPVVQNGMKYWPFKVTHGGQDNLVIIVRGKKLYPEQIVARIFSSLKRDSEEFLNQKIIDAVITVPTHFNDVQRQATRETCEIAGLNVIRIITKATAAVLAYNYPRTFYDLKTFLVFNFGTAELEISILNMHGRNIKLIGHGSDIHLGGKDIDKVLVDYCISKFEKVHGIDSVNIAKSRLRYLKNECESQKIYLSVARKVLIEVATIYQHLDLSIHVKRDTFNVLCQQIFEKCIQLLGNTIKDSGISKDLMDEVILVGGSSKIPAIQSRITDFFDGKVPLQTFKGGDPCASGAAILANSLTRTRNEAESRNKAADWKLTEDI